MVAETFLIAWRKFDTVPTGIEAKYWLFGVARRVLYGQLRKSKAANRVTDRLKQSLSRASLESLEESVIDRFTFEQILQLLPVQDQEIIKLSVWEGFTSIEIGKILEMPPATIRTRLARIRAKLKKEFSAHSTGLKHNSDFLHLHNNGQSAPGEQI